MVRYIILLISSILCIGCAPPKFIPKEPPVIAFQKELPYTVDLSDIITPDKPVYLWVDKDFNQVPMNDATYLLLTKKEFAKFTAQLKIKETYKEIIMKQEVLINAKIAIINSLKEYVALEQMKVTEYRSLWADSENAYRQEKYYNEINNVINKGFLGFISIGALIALIIAL
jgi:hypothetical protein